MPTFALAGSQSRGTEHGEIIALCSTAREDDLAWFAFQNGRDAIARGIESCASFLTNVMNARWISEDAVQIRKHRSAYVRVERRGGVVIEINRAHIRMMHQKSAGTSCGECELFRIAGQVRRLEMQSH